MSYSCCFLPLPQLNLLNQRYDFNSVTWNLTRCSTFSHWISKLLLSFFRTLTCNNPNELLLCIWWDFSDAILGRNCWLGSISIQPCHFCSNNIWSNLPEELLVTSVCVPSFIKSKFKAKNNVESRAIIPMASWVTILWLFIETTTTRLCTC